MAETPSGSVKSVRRVFEVLECFARLRAPLSAIEIGRRLDYPASSTAGILKTMVSLGYLAFDRSSRTYFPTIRLPLLCDWIDGAVLGDLRLEQLVEKLRTSTGETIIVAAQNDLEAQYLLVRPGAYPIRFGATAGMTRPLCASGTGWALLAQRNDTEIQAIAQRLNRAARAKRKIDPEALLQQISLVRHQGYATSYGTVVAGSGIIAMAIPALPGERILAIGVGGPVERLQKSEASIVRKLRSALRTSFPGRKAFPRLGS